MRTTVPAIVMLHYLAQSKQNKTPSVKFKFKATPPGEPAFEIWADLWITDATVERTEATLRNCFDWDGRLETCSSGNWVGEKVMLVLDDVEFDGSTRTKVRFINPVRVQQDPEVMRQVIESAQAVLNRNRTRPIVGDLPVPMSTTVTRHPNPIMSEQQQPDWASPVDPFGEGVPF